jgi:hypothetical protein
LTNVHFHALLFDGVYTRASPTARPVFHRLPPPTDAGIAELLTQVHRRVRRLLIRRGRWSEDDPGSDPLAAQEPLFASAVAASLQGRVALGPRAGQPVRRLRSAAAVTATGRRSARLHRTLMICCSLNRLLRIVGLLVDGVHCQARER